MFTVQGSEREEEGAADDDAGVLQHQLDQSQLSVEIVTANHSSPGPAG